MRVSDIDITRYQAEFLEIAEIASGEFGVVKTARHRLDGMVYAIKVSKKAIRRNSHDEKMVSSHIAEVQTVKILCVIKAMNEVFAHAALMKHKHVVRYYNSWVEGGAVSYPAVPPFSFYKFLPGLYPERVLRGRKSAEQD